MMMTPIHRNLMTAPYWRAVPLPKTILFRLADRARMVSRNSSQKKKWPTTSSIRSQKINLVNKWT